MVEFDLNEELIQLALDCEHDPLLFAETAFAWGEGELEGKDGLREWQSDLLCDLGERLRDGKVNLYEAIQLAIASGHGIGKSALVSVLILWAMATKVDTKGVVTANTENQLKTKTWAELSKWYRLCAFESWFTFTATALFSVDASHEKTWRIDMIPWSERNTEAFAGLHNEGKRILLVFDEASAIPDAIWEVSEGALTDENTEIIWCVFGNPTRNTGRFRECFGRLKHRWHGRQIDSRNIEGTNKNQLQKWVDDYGEDDDFVRVRVRGVFPNCAVNQFISSSSVMGASKRHLTDPLATSEFFNDPIVVGVDVARFGDDESVIRVRIGRDARSIRPLKFRGMDTMQLASKVGEVIDGSLTGGQKVDACFVDGGGVGGGVVDRLIQLNYAVIEVNFGGKAIDRKYLNKRAEMWGNMKDWLEFGAIDGDDQSLMNDLPAVEYGYNLKNQIQLEKKDDMKKRGLSSPDDGDSLALTFAFPVAKRPIDYSSSRFRGGKRDYNPLDDM